MVAGTFVGLRRLPKTFTAMPIGSGWVGEVPQEEDEDWLSLHERSWLLV
jgi:hypothetical protein